MATKNKNSKQKQQPPSLAETIIAAPVAAAPYKSTKPSSGEKPSSSPHISSKAVPPSGKKDLFNASLNMLNTHSVLLQASANDLSAGVNAIMQKNASLNKEFLRCKNATDVAEMQKKTYMQGVSNAQELFTLFSSAMTNCSTKTMKNLSENFEHIFPRSH